MESDRSTYMLYVVESEPSHIFSCKFYLSTYNLYPHYVLRFTNTTLVSSNNSSYSHEYYIYRYVEYLTYEL